MTALEDAYVTERWSMLVASSRHQGPNRRLSYVVLSPEHIQEMTGKKLLSYVLSPEHMLRK